MQGNVDFTGGDQDNAQVTNRNDLANISRLLDVGKEDLEKALLTRVIAAGGNVVEKQLHVNDAQYARNAFAKVISSRG